MKNKPEGHFYFPLFRAITLLCGGDSGRAERNGGEALLVCCAIYLIHYLFFTTLCLSPNLNTWWRPLLLILLAFWTWIFWLLLVYLNSLIIKALQRFGLFREVPVRRMQSVFWIAFTTAMAFSLLQRSPILHEVAAIWLMAVAMNLVAAAILTFSNATRHSGE